MKLFNSIGPNPKVVRMFLAEKDLTLPMIEVDLRGGENRQAPYTDKNPSGQCPCLELDDGAYLSEITAICEYLEDKQPTPPLIGTTPEEKAETRMWVRRIDLNILEPMANGFRYSTGLKMFQERLHCIPQAADDLKATAQEKLAWLDGLMADKAYVCGDRFTLFCGVDDVFLESYALGAEGWVSGLVNAFPAENALIWDLCEEGKWEEAREVYRWYSPLLNLDTMPKLVQYIKLASQECGYGNERCRAPRLNVEGEEREWVLGVIRKAIETRPAIPEKV